MKKLLCTFAAALLLIQNIQYIVSANEEKVPVIAKLYATNKYKIIYEAEAADSELEYASFADEKALTVNCSEAGEYCFTTYYQRSVPDAEKAVTISVNGETSGSFDCGGCIGYGSDIPVNFVAVTINVQLTKGMNTISVTTPDTEVVIDKFELTNYRSAEECSENNFAYFGIDITDEVVMDNPKITTVNVCEKIPYGQKNGDINVWWTDSSSDKERCFVLALYDSKGDLIDVDYITKKFTSLMTENIEFKNVSFTDVKSLKIFAFEDMDNIGPMAENLLTGYKNKQESVTSVISPCLSILHLTTDKEVAQNVKGSDWGQLIYDFEVSPYDPNHVIATTDTVGAYSSYDGGITWENTSEGLTYSFTNDVEFDPVNKGDVYLAVTAKSTAQRDYQDMGVYKSSDNGKTWALDLYAKYDLTNLGGRNQFYWQKDFNGDYKYLYAVTSGSGIYRKNVTANNPEWVQLYSGTDLFYDVYASNLDSNGNALILAVGNNGIVKSDNNGVTWVNVAVEVDSTAITPNAVAVYPDNQSLWYIVDNKSLYKSEDAGFNWSLVKKIHTSAIPNLTNVKFSNYKATETSPYRMFFSSSMLSAPIRYTDSLDATEINRIVYYTSDGSQMTREEYWPHFYSINKATGKMYVIRKGLATTEDGCANMTIRLSQGMSGFPMNSIVFDDYGMPKWMSFTDNGLYRADANNSEGEIYPTLVENNLESYDGSKSSSVVIVDPNDSSHILAVTGHYGYSAKTAVVQSFDNGETWDYIKDSEGNNISEDKAIKFLKYSPKNSKVIYAGCLRSDDNGQTWYEMSNMIHTENETDYELQLVDVSKNGRLLAVNTNIRYFYTSDDDGQTWDISEKIIANIFTAAFDIEDDNYVWVSAYNYLQKMNTTTGSLDINYNISNSAAWRIAQNPTNPDHILIITRDVFYYRVENNSVWESFDGGRTWSDLSESRGYPKIAYANSIVFNPPGNAAYIGTYMGIIVYKY